MLYCIGKKTGTGKENIMPKRKKTLYTVANAHLDTQWNWTIQDTIRDAVKNTLEGNFRLLDKYPHYRFNFEGAFRYKLAKEYYPDLCAKIQKYVDEGRWHFAGSSWDACDANVPSSEAIMRQVLYGNAYMEKEFGISGDDIFLPDCFGFSGSLPSIAAHMGLVGFSTQKLVWGAGAPLLNDDGTVAPPIPNDKRDEGDKRERMDLCRWTGPDGNGITASFLEGDYTYTFNAGGDNTPVNKREAYLKLIERNEKCAGVPLRSMYYGIGDFGGAPLEDSVRMLGEAINDRDGGLYDIISSASSDIFNELTDEEKSKIPNYHGSLLIPHGYGAMVAHTISKRWNRRCEMLADAAETACSMALYFGADYPADRLTEAWQTFLWHQFHDDLTGTSIGDAYTFSYNDYIIAQNRFASELCGGIASLSGALDTSLDGTPIIVYNPASSARCDIASVVTDIAAEHVRVYDADDTEIPSSCEKSDDKLTVRFAASVKPTSVTVYYLRTSDLPCEKNPMLAASSDTIENEYLRVSVNSDGDIASVFDKSLGRELLSAPVHFEIMQDTIDTGYPAWEYKYEDFAEPYDTVTATPTVTYFENAAAVGLNITRKYKNSTYRQTLTLAHGSHRLDVDNSIDWFEHSSMLRVAFPLTAKNPTAVFDRGLGAEEFGNTNSYPYFQYLVHKWARLDDKDGGFGVAIMNDCKYSMDKPDDSTLRLTLIRTPKGEFSPRSSQDYMDFGLNLFRFSIMGLGKSYNSVAAEAEAVNKPLYTFIADKHSGGMSEFSLASVFDEALVLRCIKKEERGYRHVIRVQETAGRAHTDASVRFASDIASAVMMNGYEKEISDADFNGCELHFDIQPYGIRTFAVSLTAPSIDARKPEYTALSLNFTKRITTTNNDRESAEIVDGISVPSEMYREHFTAGGVPFTLAPADSNNAVVCRGQTLKLPKGCRRVSVLCASSKVDRETCFTVSGRSVNVTVQDFGENIGSWDLFATGALRMIKRAELAESYTHTHDADGDRLYKFANIFKYDFDTDGASELTLPDDENIIVTAATAQIGGTKVIPAYPLYDIAEPYPEKLHRLTVEGGHGSGMYPEGRPIVLWTTDIGDGSMFDGWECDDAQITSDGMRAFLTMGEHDIKVIEKRTFVGENLLLGNPVSASDYVAGSEPHLALEDGYNNRWFGNTDNNGHGWLEVDLGGEKTIYGWQVIHASVREKLEYNTADYRLEYRLTADEPWKTADKVEGNTRNRSLRKFNPVNACYIRLYITKAAQDGDRHCRIHHFQVYGK